MFDPKIAAQAQLQMEQPFAKDLFDLHLRAGLPLEKEEALLIEGFRKEGRRKLADILHGIRLDVVYRRAEGAYLEYLDAQGKTVRVLDALSGYGAGLLGHNPKALVRLAEASLKEGLTLNAQASCRGWSSKLCSSLSNIFKRQVGRDYLIHLLNTGSEVAEAAVHHAELVRRERANQLARKAEASLERLRAAWPRLPAEVQATLLVQRQPIFLAPSVRQKIQAILQHTPVFFALEDGYHGSGCASAQLSHGERYRKGLSHTGIEVRFVGNENVAGFRSELETLSAELIYPEVDRRGQWSLKAERVSRVAAIFVEVIQGEGGIHEIPIHALQGFSAAAKEHGVALIVDEIQTGLGRCGSMFALEKAELKPEIILLSKVLGGGMAKIGACAIARDFYHDDFSLKNVSTFAEDDASSRMACGVLEILESPQLNVLARVRSIGARLKSGLLELQKKWPQVIHQVRGQGLMLGVELASQETSGSPMIRALDATEALAMTACGWFLHEHQIRIAPATRHARTLRVEPSLCLTEEEVEHILASMDAFCRMIATPDAVGLTAFLHQESPPQKFEESATEMQHAGPGSLCLAPNLDVGTSYGIRHRWPQVPAPKIPRIAFLGHPIDAHSVRGVEPQFAGLSDSALLDMLDRMTGSPQTYPQRRFRVRSSQESQVDAVIHSWQPLPETWMRARRDRGLRARLRESIQDAIEECIDEGCRVVGFGAFTSIFTSSCDDIRNSQVYVTSGNGLTAGMADRAVREACEEQGIDLGSACVAVVGATGNIGTVHAQLLAPSVRQLVLIGPDGSLPRLQELREQVLIETPTQVEILCTTDASVIKECPVVISATNTARPLFHGKDFCPGTGVFLDVSVPSDLHPGCAEQRPDILFLKGGVVRLPKGKDGMSSLELPGWHLPTGHVYACLAETLLLGLEGVERDYSCGPLVVEDVRGILNLADRHGFTLGGIEKVKGVGA